VNTRRLACTEPVTALGGGRRAHAMQRGMASSIVFFVPDPGGARR
jgi:hypothetical protein